jgi:hypothetical protein
MTANGNHVSKYRAFVCPRLTILDLVLLLAIWQVCLLLADLGGYLLLMDVIE